MFASKLKKLVPSKEPVSLTNRTHTAGVHQKAMLNNAATYEAFPLDQFGVNEAEMLLGPLSGWNMIHYYLKEIKYYNLDDETARKIATVFKERIYDLGLNVSPTEILVAIAEDEFGLTRLSVPEEVKDSILQRLDEQTALENKAEALNDHAETAGEFSARDTAVSLKR
jgi:homocitrate synthase